jgi:hypothetical protein
VLRGPQFGNWPFIHSQVERARIQRELCALTHLSWVRLFFKICPSSFSRIFRWNYRPNPTCPGSRLGSPARTHPPPLGNDFLRGRFFNRRTPLTPLPTFRPSRPRPQSGERWRALEIAKAIPPVENINRCSILIWRGLDPKWMGGFRWTRLSIKYTRPALFKSHTGDFHLWQELVPSTGHGNIQSCGQPCR